MNILIFSEPSYPRHPGGAGKCTHLLAAGLVERGHIVHILCQSNEEQVREQIDGVHVHRLRLSNQQSIPKQKREADTVEKIFNYLEKHVPLSSLDIIHDSGGFLSYFFPLEYKLCHLYHIPFVVHFRYLLLKHQWAISHRRIYAPFSRLALWCESRLHETTQCFPTRIAHLVICLSNEDAKFVNSAFKPEPENIVVVPDPVDTHLYSPDEGQILRKQLAKPGEKLVLFGGRINSELKGGDIVLRAFKKMLSLQPGLRLLLLSQGDKELTPFLRQLGPAVTSLGWIRDARELSKVFSAADLVLMPSRYESFGMMCAEAMAAGTPVIASPVGGLLDLISHGQNGFLFSTTDSKAWDHELVKYALEILSNPKLAVTMGDNARKFVTENLGIQKIAERTEQSYYKVLSKRNSRDHGLIIPPEVNSRDKERYLAFLYEKIGAAASEAGTALLTRWPDSIDQRCLSCTRKRVATDIRRLLSLKPFQLPGIGYKMVGKFKKKVQSAVESACPLGLLQKMMTEPGK